MKGKGMAKTSDSKLVMFFDRFFTFCGKNIQSIIDRLPRELNTRYLLLFCVASLIMIGTMMITSASMPAAIKLGVSEFNFVYKHFIVMVGCFLLVVVGYHFINDKKVFGFIPLLLIGSMGLLVLVRFIGDEVNGAIRWISFAGVSIQPSEFAKLALSLHVADCLVRRDEEIRNSIRKGWNITIPAILIILGVLLGSDLGTAVVLGTMVLGLFFIGGVKIKQVISLVVIGIVAMVLLITTEEYRLERAISFLDPFKDIRGDGYQVANSLMAYGLGEWFGVGLGQSVQKLSYLPEAHTDFILAIFAEEFGFVGICVLFSLAFTMVVCCMRIGLKAISLDYYREGYVCYAFAIILGAQIFINASVTLGMLPAKGLTFPFLSYGGSSFLVCLVMIAFVLRIDTKCRVNKDPANPEVKEYRSK